MEAGIQVDATLFGKVGIRVRSLIKPEKPVKFEDSSITLGVPVLGAVTVFLVKNAHPHTL
tara:strand:- start:39 stop:218 length:180 start_codon:yes stop_codon:yes gene_type:complete